MSTDLDLDDVAATSDKARAELAALRAEVERLTAIVDNSPLDQITGCDCCGATTDDGSEVDGHWQCRACSLEYDLANLRAGDIHTCHDHCPRPLCVAKRALRDLYDASIAPRDAAHGAAWQAALRQAKAALEGGSDES